LLVVGTGEYLTSAAFLAAACRTNCACRRTLSRPGTSYPLRFHGCRGLLPLAPKEDGRKSEATLFDYSLFIVASLNVICTSPQRFRAPFRCRFFLAELEQDVQLRGGAVWSAAGARAPLRTVRSMAVSDPLTGLANYRR